MFRVKWANKTVLSLLLVAVLCPALHAEPADEAVESYLRDRRMNHLLEVQLESRLSRTSEEQDRARLGEQLAQLYLTQLREIDPADPYRQVMIIRAKALFDRVPEARMIDLRLELFIIDYATHEDAIELHRLGLLSDMNRATARETLSATSRGLQDIMQTLGPDLDRTRRRRALPRGSEDEGELAAQAETLRRQYSLASYYLGWCGYGLAVLENRHVEDDTYIAFARLLGSDGGMPQQSELGLAAIEYDHVAHSAIGVSLCYAQSEGYSLAESWLNALIESELISDEVRHAAQSRKLQVLAMARDWYRTHVYANELTDMSAGVYLSVADARFISMQALDSRITGNQDSVEAERATNVAQLGIEHLIEQGEIGHVVDLYQRYEHLSLLASGFIPNYAKALSALNRAESTDQGKGYLDIVKRFGDALESPDASNYPAHREDCRLKLAYTLIRADRPDDAIEHCDRVISGSLRPESIEEGRWLKLAALDRQNVLAGRQFSTQLDRAVREYVEAYPDSPRTARLILRHAMRGTLDEKLAIETLGSIAEDDPIAVPARRTLVQLQYQLLRSDGYDDPDLISGTRALVDWLIEQPIMQGSDQDLARTEMAILRIGIDLALRDDPRDPQRARELIELAESRIGSIPAFSQFEPELLVRRVQIALIENRVELALSIIDSLRQLETDKAEYAELLTLNALVERWEAERMLKDTELLADFGVAMLARLTPKAPDRIGLQTSSLNEVICHAIEFLGDARSDRAATELALRLAKQILERGSPSEEGLRRTARLAEALDDQSALLAAWLRLLAAYPQDDARWFEARYESLRVMLSIDPERATSTYAQFKVLNPTLGPPPWNERIASLFAEPLPDPADSGEGKSP